MIKYIDHLKDQRVDCFSILLKIKINDYLDFIKRVYDKKGGIEGQRSPLKTKSAQRIRKRLIQDLVKGTIIPPIVIGVRLERDIFLMLSQDVQTNIFEIFPGIDAGEQASIIDGMQRTTALFEALSIEQFDRNNEIRLELWVAESTNSLIYRMLVLNSGQIPWNLKRQLEVVFSQLKKELELNIEGLSLFTSDDSESRSKAGEYQASQFIELFMLFGTKRVAIDIQEELAEEFARLDIIETSGNSEFMNIFYGVSRLLVAFDGELSRLTENHTDIQLSKYKAGKNVFSSQPARVGFMVAASQEIFGLPGMQYPLEEQLTRFNTINEKMRTFFSYIHDLPQKELFDVIDLPTLDENINIKTSRIGEFERNFFFKSFKTFIEIIKSNPQTILTPCWRSTL